MAVVRRTVHIVGTCPILWHRFGPDALPLEKKARSGVAGNDPQEWRKTVLVTAKGQLYLEDAYIFGCLRNGAKHTRKGKGSLQAAVISSLKIVDKQILVDRWLPKHVEKLSEGDGQPVYLDVRSVCNPVTRARNIRYRVAASAGWKAAFTIQWENTLVSVEQMESIANDAGRFAGLGDGRNLGFGRFEVTSFQEVADRRAKKPAV